MHAGIDYGSKLAGTTVICWDDNHQLHLSQSDKKKDADAFVRQKTMELKTNLLFLDAPLSLPPAYTQNSDEFFIDNAIGHSKPCLPCFSVA